jgi:hypothetical protein
MVIDFVPIEFYTPLYYNVLLMVVIVTFLKSQIKTFVVNSNSTKINLGGFLLFWFVLLYMGLRPIHGVFLDMTTYAFMFDRLKEENVINTSGDILYNYFTFFCSKLLSTEQYFLACSVVYLTPLYLVSKKWFSQYWFYGFLMLVGSFTFWNFGVNGIRNGMATSLFLLAVSREKRKNQILWLIVSFGFHSSLLLPIIGFVITWFYNKPTAFLKFWFLSIPLSLLLPGFWESIFAVFMESDKASYLADDSLSDSFSSTGFRWDFLLYSATGVFAGWYYFYKVKFDDNFYKQLFSTFLFANALWILVIRASFSNRFAYLSWFMLAIIIIYPLLRKNIVTKQSQKIGLILLTYFAFTYFMNVIL